MQRIESFVGQYLWLSNNYDCPIQTADGAVFMSVAHALEYEKFCGSWKTLDPIRLAIKNAKGYGQAQQIAAKNESLLPSDFRERTPHIMRRLLSQKFARGSILGECLHATADAQILGDEGTGVMLMQIREENRAEQ